MVAVILIFGFFGIALGTGWVAQLLVGKGRAHQLDPGVLGGPGRHGRRVRSIGWLLDRHVGVTFGIAGHPRGDRGRRP